MNVNEAVARRIREYQEKEKLSIARLAMLSNVPASTVKDILNGRTKGTGIDTLYKIASGLDISVRDFFDCDLFDKEMDE